MDKPRTHVLAHHTPPRYLADLKGGQTDDPAMALQLTYAMAAVLAVRIKPRDWVPVRCEDTHRNVSKCPRLRRKAQG